MTKYSYMNAYTGELYKDLRHALKTIILDMIHCPSCRTWRMLRLQKGNW